MSIREIHIKILISTYDRAEELRRTLEAFTRIHATEIAWEIVIIDNNSKDSTPAVAESFAARLPLRYLFEPRPGKNCALNRALDEVPLGRLVVFTDDDVEPEPDWLRQIIEVSARWPNHKVFGGRTELLWPGESVPNWARDPYIQQIVFSRHVLDQPEGPYPPRLFPFGANYWVRGEVFAAGRRFNEAIGPRPENRIMGSETALIKQLVDEGHAPIYAPTAFVRHRIQPNQISIDEVHRRAYRLGRQGPHVEGLCRPALLARSRAAWSLLRASSLARGAALYAFSRFDPRENARLSRAIVGLQLIGYNLESLRLARLSSNS
jgi:GT2 family glycosyltransferase